MKKAVLTLFAVMAAVGLALCVGAETANARPNYKTEFDKRYMKDGTALHTALKGKSNCNVCHLGKDRKKRNAYGLAISKALGEKMVKDSAKIIEALEKVEAEKSGDATFGALIKEGKLPITVDEP